MYSGWNCDEIGIFRKPGAIGEGVAAARVAPAMSFFEKTAGEWAAFRALAPWVRGVGCRGPAARRFLIALRAMPLHVLGIMKGTTWADGMVCSRGEFFFHDLDHARYKVREDLLALGLDCPDVTEETPAILAVASEAVRAVGPRLWALAPERLRLARELFARMDELADGELAAAAEWLLFEMVHEKSFALDREILRREAGHPGHVLKLQRKLAGGFFQDARPEVFARLEEARRWLAGVL